MQHMTALKLVPQDDANAARKAKVLKLIPQIVPKDAMETLFAACAKNDHFKISGCQKTLEKVKELKITGNGSFYAISRYVIDPHCSARQGVWGDYAKIVKITFGKRAKIELAGYLPVIVSNDELPEEIETLSNFLEKSAPFDEYPDERFIKR